MVNVEHEVNLASKVNKGRADNQETEEYLVHPGLEDSQAKPVDLAKLVSRDHGVRMVDLELKELSDDLESKAREVSVDSPVMPHSPEHPDLKVSCIHVN